MQFQKCVFIKSALNVVAEFWKSSLREDCSKNNISSKGRNDTGIDKPSYCLHFNLMAICV